MAPFRHRAVLPVFIVTKAMHIGDDFIAGVLLDDCDREQVAVFSLRQ